MAAEATAQRNHRYADEDDYDRLRSIHTDNVSEEDSKQILLHFKEDYREGGYVASNNYQEINSYLRGIKRPIQLDDDDFKTIETLRKAIDTNELDDDYILTRYVSGDYISHAFGIRDSAGKIIDKRIVEYKIFKDDVMSITERLKALVGGEITEDAFVSTSLLKSENIMKHKCVKINILAPKGTRCYLPDNIEESECILRDGTTFLFEGMEFDEAINKWVFTYRIK